MIPFHRVTLALSLLLFPALAQAAPGGPLETLKEVYNRLEPLLTPEGAEDSERRAALEKEAQKIFDFEEMGVRAAGDAWEGATPEQKAEFTALFSTLMRDRYLDQLEKYSAGGVTLSWDDEEIAGEEATVHATAQGKRKGFQVKMLYKLIQDESGWKIYDVITDGTSLLEANQKALAKLYKKEKSFDALLARLREVKGE